MTSRFVASRDRCDTGWGGAAAPPSTYICQYLLTNPLRAPRVPYTLHTPYAPPVHISNAMMWGDTKHYKIQSYVTFCNTAV